jgi:flavin-dependent dehydrogenase
MTAHTACSAQPAEKEGDIVMRRSEPLKIIGAGPAGLAAAIHLAKNGCRVIVYEKNPDVGMRFHNDFQGLENWTTEDDVLSFLRSMSIEADFYCKPVYGGLLYGPSEHAAIHSAEPLVYLVKRGSSRDTLDRSLKRQALDSGVRIEFNTTVPAGEGDVIATGPKKPDMFAVGLVFDTDVADTAVIVLNNDIAPKGYAYLLAADGRGTLATVLYAHFDRCDQYLDKAVATFRGILDFELRNPARFSGFGNFFLKKSAFDKGRRLVGEAAGFQDFLFGFGIRYAITSGYLAAKSIIEDIDYDHLWKLGFSKQLKMSALNRRLYEMFGNFAYNNLVKKTIASGNPRRLWQRFYNTSFRGILRNNDIKEEAACDTTLLSGH